MLILHFSVLELGLGKPELVPNMTLKCQAVMWLLHFALRFILTFWQFWIVSLKLLLNHFSPDYDVNCILQIHGHILLILKSENEKPMLITNRFLQTAVMSSGVLPQHLDLCDQHCLRFHIILNLWILNKCWLFLFWQNINYSLLICWLVL